MKNKILPAIIGAAILLGFYFYTFPKLKHSSTVVKTETRKETIQVSQKIKTNFEPVAIEKGKTALDLLKQTTKLETKGEGKNAFVISINGRSADEKKKEYWSIYINGKPAELGAGSYILQSGDKIEWRIETY